jgi:flagellar biosynthesis/type III secretory pathway chaperone
MKEALVNEIADALIGDLKVFAAVCEDLLNLATREHQALAGEADYLPMEFYQERKTLLPDVEALPQKFRNHRKTWQQIPECQREQFSELKTLFQHIQGLVTRVIQLDRENQQAMLKRGLVPVKHLPGVARQPSHFVADLYRRNSAD